MIRKLFSFIFILVILSAGILYWVSQKGIALPLTEGVLNRQLQTAFPVEKTYYMVLHLSLENPKVYLTTGKDKIGLGLDVSIRTGLKSSQPHRGSLDVETNLRFDKNTSSIYLVDPKVNDFALEGVPEEYTGKALSAVNMTLKDILNVVPIYTIGDDHKLLRLAKMFLKDVRIEDGRLKVILGL